MNKLAVACALFVSLSLTCGPSDARKRKVAEDPLLELDEEEFGVSLTRGRTIYDYQGAQQLKEAPPESTRILVTTQDRMPDGKTYPIAEAIYESLKEKFPSTEFKVVGRTSLDDFIQMIRENYDYVFTVGTNYSSRQYDSERTTYSSRSTGVRCKRNMLGDGVDCNESSSSIVPTGSRTVKRWIFSDIFFVTYGVAAGATKEYSTDHETQVSSWQVSTGESIGNTSIRLGYGTTDASWCENPVGAQVYLARMIAKNVVSTRPDEFSRTVAPDEIGCYD